MKIVFLLALLAAGYAFRKSRPGGGRSSEVSFLLNRWVIRVALPSLVLLKIHSLPSVSLSDPAVLLPASQPWLQFFLALIAVTLAARALGWSRTVWGALVMTIGLGNTSFVGLPLLEAVLGPGALPTGVLQDQLGSFLVLSLVGVPFAQTVASNSRTSRGGSGSGLAFLLRPIRFPAFLALVAALLLASVPFPRWFESLLEVLAWSLSPAALLSVGMSMSLGAAKKRSIRLPLAFGLAMKLVVFPTVMVLLYPALARAAGGLEPLVLQTLLLEAAMASQITGGVVAADQGLEPELARLMVGLSIPLSLATVPLWKLWVCQL